MNSVEEHRVYAPDRLSFAVLTASDSRSETGDDSGRKIVEMATAAGHQVGDAHVIPDEIPAIRSAVARAVELGADVVVLNGGTGLASRDVSVEAVMPLLDRLIEGFGELFRALSFQQIGPAAMLSRSVAGVVGRSVLFVLPGSPKAVELAMAELILPEVGHLVGQIRR
jgi:molybdenum cofactor biosynthesis protein B